MTTYSIYVYVITPSHSPTPVLLSSHSLSVSVCMYMFSYAFATRVYVDYSTYSIPYPCVSSMYVITMHRVYHSVNSVSSLFSRSSVY
ncbi:hypothetical protein EON63_22875 [archaeon]|nr:MAG: hypothetical protein EON63_22875 [archaeon]